MKRFWDKVDKSGDCWEWIAGKNDNGYGRFHLNKKARSAHRVAWELTNGPIPDDGSYHGTCVCHRCDNPGCVNPDHLFLGNHADNLSDMAKKGRQANLKGQQNGRSVLTEEDVRRIRQLDVPQRKIARCFGVSSYAIFAIKSRKTWSHIN